MHLVLGALSCLPCSMPLIHLATDTVWAEAYTFFNCTCFQDPAHTTHTLCDHFVFTLPRVRMACATFVLYPSTVVMFGCMLLLTGTGGQRARVWDLGPRVACVDVLHARHHAPAGALAGQPAVQAVWRAPLQGRGQDRHQAACGESLRSGAPCGCESVHLVVFWVLTASQGVIFHLGQTPSCVWVHKAPCVSFIVRGRGTLECPKNTAFEDLARRTKVELNGGPSVYQPDTR